MKWLRDQWLALLDWWHLHEPLHADAVCVDTCRECGRGIVRPTGKLGKFWHAFPPGQPRRAQHSEGR